MRSSAWSNPPGASFQIVQVNIQSDRGGDGRIVTSLHENYRALGFSARLIVGRATIDPEGKEVLPNDAYRSHWAQALLSGRRTSIHRSPRSRYGKLLSWIAEPQRHRRIRSGFEDFDFPATFPVLSRMIRERPTILHLHNLHGGYFDLRTLPALGELAPVVLTLHDQWAFTGHCAHSFGCERWTTGCGNCPDLTIYPGIPKDRTAENFALKQDIFSRSRLYVTAPSTWLLDKANRSLLAPAIQGSQVIPNGVDTTVFQPGDVQSERSRLKLPRDSRIVLCAGSIARSDHWTDQRVVDSTLNYLVREGISQCTILFLGSAMSSDETTDGLRIIHRPYERDPSRVAGYYKASDVYLHPARADTFPTAILESIACGLPVAATSVGGIPEQVKSLWATSNAPASPPNQATGMLVDPHDTMGLGRAINVLLSDDDLRRRLGRNGSRAAASDFSITDQARSYLQLYRVILSGGRPTARSAAGAATRTQGLPQ